MYRYPCTPVHYLILYIKLTLCPIISYVMSLRLIMHIIQLHIHVHVRVLIVFPFPLTTHSLILTSTHSLTHTHTPYTQPPPQLRPFNTEQFLKSMEGTGPHLTTGIKGNWNGLYRRFLDSPNFVGWYTVRKEEANQKLRLLHLDQLCKAVSSGGRCGGEPLLLVVIIFILLSCAKL